MCIYVIDFAMMKGNVEGVDVELKSIAACSLPAISEPLYNESESYK